MVLYDWDTRTDTSLCHNSSVVQSQRTAGIRMLPGQVRRIIRVWIHLIDEKLIAKSVYILLIQRILMDGINIWNIKICGDKYRGKEKK